MKKLLYLSTLILVMLQILMPSGVMAQTSGYKIVKRIQIGGEGGGDYMFADTAARRLYVSHAERLCVIDLDNNTVIGEIANTPGIHGIALAPDLGRGFTSNGGDDSVTIFDLKTLATIDKVKATGTNPDCIVYDPASHRVFTFNRKSGNTTVIEASSGKVISTIDLKGHSEYATTDNKGRVYVAVDDSSAIDVFDSLSLRMEQWPVAACRGTPGPVGPVGLSIDRENRRLFASCRNSIMAVVDGESGRVVATLPIGSGSDGSAYDPGTHLAFSANGGDGTMTVVHEDTPEKFTVLETVVTEPRAKTIAIDEKTHRVYLPSSKIGSVTPPTPDNPKPKKDIISGSFAILVLDR
jgi:DNA-binding beta-propeller fold protein YncE